MLCVHVYLVCSCYPTVFFISSTGMESSEDVVDKIVVTKLENSLGKVEKELQETRERKASLERECVIYQSQLDVSEMHVSFDV